MKLIKAYIRYRKMEEVYQALQKEGFHSMTMMDCEGTGQYADQEKEHISYKYPYADAYKVVKLEILVEKERVDRLVEIIRKNARTGYRGDGMVIVSPVEEVFKVRTDENGIAAI